MIPAWLLTTKAKLIGTAILILAVAWWFKHELTKAEERGAKRKEVSMLLDEGNRIDAAVAEKLALYARERIELDAQRTALASERKALSVERREVFSAQMKEIGSIASKGAILETEIKAVPADALDGRIRAALVRARAADAELARIRASQ